MPFNRSIIIGASPAWFTANFELPNRRDVILILLGKLGYIGAFFELSVLRATDWAWGRAGFFPNQIG